MNQYNHQQTNPFTRIPRATREEKERLLSHILSIVQHINQHHPNQAARLRVQRLVWQRVLGTADLTRIDLATLFGFFSGIHTRLEHATRHSTRTPMIDSHPDEPDERETSKA